MQHASCNQQTIFSWECLAETFGNKTHWRYHYSKCMQNHYLGEDCLEMGISFFE